MQTLQIEKDQSFKKEIEFFTKRISKLTRERDRLRDSSGRLFESRRLEREEEELKNTELLLRLTKLEDSVQVFKNVLEQANEENRKLKEQSKDLNNNGQAARNKLLDLTKEK